MNPAVFLFKTILIGFWLYVYLPNNMAHFKNVPYYFGRMLRFFVTFLKLPHHLSSLSLLLGLFSHLLLRSRGC